MLTEFRSRYPTGCLISELLTIYQGHYLVRTLVQVDGLTLATAMAAEPTVEQAEDRSRQRALAVLGISQMSGSGSIPEPPERLSSDRSSAPAFSTVHLGQGRTRSRPPATGIGSATDFSEPTIGSTRHVPPSPPSVEPASTRDDSWLTSEGYGESTTSDPSFSRSERSSHPSFSQTPPPKTEFQSPTEFDPPYEPTSGLDLDPDESSEVGDRTETNTVPGPVDMSDLIAESTLEIKRLGWTSDRGKEHLKLHYGKPSRSMLSPDELQDFINYLKAQPTPS